MASEQPGEQRAVVLQPPRHQVDHVALALDHALHPQQARPEQFPPLALGEVAPDDDVDAAGLVLQRHEYHAARGIGLLPAGDQPCGARAAAVAALGEHRADLATSLKREAFPAVRDALRSESGRPASMLVLIGLMDAFGPEADECLVPLASHPDPEVLTVAAEALARRRAIQALPPLEAVLAGALNDPRFAPRPGRPDPAELLSRLEVAVVTLQNARAATAR